MRELTMWLAAAGLGLSVLGGCSQNPMTVRGQAPAEGMPGLMPQGQMQGGVPNFQQVAPGAMPYGMPFDPTSGGSYDPNANGPDMSGGAGPTGYERSFRFKYKEPRDLRYPPVGDKPAVVQYPYYTFKGPDDFFHK